MNKKPKGHKKCPCNSKKKYRNCCGKINTVKFDDLPPETQKLYRELQLKWKIATQYHHQYFGHVYEIQSCTLNGRRMVCVGGSIVSSDNPNQDWKTPIQFLSSHLKTTLGNKWFENEICKLPNEQHILIKWCVESKMLSDENNLTNTQFNGSALAYLHVAYDLFTLHNHNYLTSKLINRLKNQDNFNGARYELFALATMVRAGFKLEIYDESLGIGKIPECKAIHIETNTELEVEAKARHVKGIHGSKQGKKSSFNLYTKCLKPAIEKKINKPYIIFVDINIPELDIYNDQEKLDRIRKEYDMLQNNYPNELPNIVCFTNIPFHYAKEDFSVSNSAYGLVFSKSPQFKLKNEMEIRSSIQDALSKYAYLPREFNESQEFADQIIKNGFKL